VIALAITLTIALCVVLAMVLFSASGQSDGIRAYAGGVSEVFLILLAVGFVVGFLTLLLLRRKSS
jgi:Mg2+/citrate symporter